MGVVPAGSGQNVVVVRGVCHLLADVDDLAVDRRNRGPVHQAIDEGRIWILKNLLDRPRELVGRLRPIVIFHGDHEYGLDFLRSGIREAQEGKCRQRGKLSEVRHSIPPKIGLGRERSTQSQTIATPSNLNSSALTED